jgi:hypothetical protein
MTSGQIFKLVGSDHAQGARGYIADYNHHAGLPASMNRVVGLRLGIPMLISILGI